MGSYKKIGLSHEMGLIDTPPLIVGIIIILDENVSCGINSKKAGSYQSTAQSALSGFPQNNIGI